MRRRCSRPRDITLTPKAMKDIERVGQWVNAHIRPVSDIAHWGVIDQWDYPSDGKGDCEDYALVKRKILIEEGFPRQALLMTVVKDEHNDGHAVLTVKTNAGDFVLDNMNDEVKPWDRTVYRFVKRQAQSDPNMWVQIGDPTAAPDYVSREKVSLHFFMWPAADFQSLDGTLEFQPGKSNALSLTPMIVSKKASGFFDTSSIASD